jgi:hypothetical protein
MFNVLRSCQRLVEWLRRYHACLASVKPQVQTTVPPKKKEKLPNNFPKCQIIFQIIFQPGAGVDLRL